MNVVAHDDFLTIRRVVRLARPRTPDQLHSYVRLVLGFRVPRVPIMAGHDAPFDYLMHAFFEDTHGPRDCVVWANRGGGKTQLAAIATLLDLVFKPGIQVRILGGSMDQSSKMFAYLTRMISTDVFSDLVVGRITNDRLELANGSRVEVLSQSLTAIRGHRVHRIRCDEVELFDPVIWEAAQLVTRSGTCGNVTVRASVEAMSTMHRPFGIMQKLVREADNGVRRLFRWSLIDTLERCPPARLCETCLLWEECQGRAKQARGFLDIDDAIQQKRRVDRDTWLAEMLCERPGRSDCVYREFDAQAHVIGLPSPFGRGAGGEGISVNTTDGPHPLPGGEGIELIGGIDFGYRAPTVILFAMVDQDGVLTILDELSVTEHTTNEIIDLAELKLQEHGWPRPVWMGADPAGRQRSEHTGRSTISLWQRAGWPVRARSLALQAGIDAVKHRLRAGDRSIALKIHRRCEVLIRSMSLYHYSEKSPEAVAPVKDGHDHACDALRYLVINLDLPQSTAEYSEY